MSKRLVIPFLLIICPILSAAKGSDDTNFDKLEARYAGTIQPLLQKHCLGCHSTEKMEGDLDLQRFARFEIVRNEPELWRHVSEQISSGEMPPKNRPRPTGDEHETILGWIREYLRAEALAAAGDPGPGAEPA